jgi:hypothetical protein
VCELVPTDDGYYCEECGEWVEEPCEDEEDDQ